MRAIRKILIICLLIMMSAAASGATVDFIISIPKDTPEPVRIFVTGNHAHLGEWDGKGAAAREIGPNLYQASVELPAGFAVEYKITRGNFSTVEKDLKGHEVPNRSFAVPGFGEPSIRLHVHNWADLAGPPSASQEPNVTGEFCFIPGFTSKHLPRDRNILVLLPPSYNKKGNETRKYPVFYMQDGNNLADPKLSFTGIDWGVDETVTRLYRENRIQEIIVVGIYNTADRNDEYTPFVDPVHKGGKGELYRKFLVEELKPYIDGKFRTLADPENTAIGGSSLGGLISLYIGVSNRRTFGKVMAMSPSFWWKNGRIIGWIEEKKAGGFPGMLWVDMGTKESEQGLQYVQRFAEKFRSVFPTAANFQTKTFPEATHTEAAWRKRLHLPLLWFFKK